jgi:peptidoglycan/LPS O-acetylase OafA/YrhL
MTYGSSLLLVDAIKALASQLIIWHHFAVYSPMSDVVYPHATTIVDWLYSNARLAVQAFLVIGGFLAARSLAPHPGAVADTFARSNLARRLWSRYLRLALPYVVALAFAIACAALARGLAADPNAPAAPSATQVLAHIFLLQDIVNVDALSAGVWYVAIDFQLYALFALLLWSAQRLARITGLPVGRVVMTLCGSLAAASLFWLNRDRTLDQWAPYFFGAYGLGVFAQWVSNSPRRNLWLAAMAAITATALVIDWRSRILVASLTALLLASGAGARLALKGVAGRAVAALGRISYPVFLIHYPVSLLVGALIVRLSPDSVAANVAALAAAWLLSLGAGAVLHRWTETRVTWPVGRFSARWAKAQ